MISILIHPLRVLGINKKNISFIKMIVSMITSMKLELRIIINLLFNINMRASMKKVNFLTINLSHQGSILSAKGSRDPPTDLLSIRLRINLYSIRSWLSRYTLLRGKSRGPT